MVLRCVLIGTVFLAPGSLIVTITPGRPKPSLSTKYLVDVADKHRFSQAPWDFPSVLDAREHTFGGVAFEVATTRFMVDKCVTSRQRGKTDASRVNMSASWLHVRLHVMHQCGKMPLLQASTDQSATKGSIYVLLYQ